MAIKITRTTNPKAKPPTEGLVFGKHFTDHMFQMEYTEGQGWHNAQIVPYGPMAIEPSAMVFHYGQAVFEGMKAYKDDDGQVRLFRPRDNFKRLNVSDERLCIPYIDEDLALEALMELIKVDRDWIPEAENTSLYIRPFVFASEPALGVHPSSQYLFMIIMCPVGPYYAEGLNPVKICIEDDYVRAVRGGTGFTKAAANYAISLKGQQKAHDLGFSQVLWLDGIERRYIEEVGAMNVFFQIDGTMVTPSLEGSILPGITRDSVITLLKSWGVPVAERRITVQELYDAHRDGKLTEAFGCGTAAVISPIGQFNWMGNTITVSDGKTGALSQRLYDNLTGIQYGRVDDPFGWTVTV